MNTLDYNITGLSELTDDELFNVNGGGGDNPIYWLGYYAHAAWDGAKDVASYIASHHVTGTAPHM